MTQRILVVDDNRRVAALVAESLSKCSAAYYTAIATSGEEAWQKMSVEPFDLVIVDLFMPDINGVKLAQELQVSYPDAQFMLMTNRGLEAKSITHELAKFPCIRKAFSIRELIATVHATLAEPEAAGEENRQQDEVTWNRSRQLSR